MRAPLPVKAHQPRRVQAQTAHQIKRKELQPRRAVKVMTRSKTSSWYPRGRQTRTRTRRRIRRTLGTISTPGCASITTPSIATMPPLPIYPRRHPKSSILESSTTLGRSPRSNGLNSPPSCVRPLTPTPRSFTTSSQASIPMSSTPRTMVICPTQSQSNSRHLLMTSMMSQPLVR